MDIFSQNDQSFEGRYDYNDTKISLRYCGAFPNQHIVELEELLYQSTSNSPEDRPTMSQFVRQLKVIRKRVISCFAANT